MADPRAPVVVIGLGRFGSSLAQGLHERDDVRMLAVDADLEVVQALSESLGNVVRADATDPESLRQLGVDAGWRAVVGIGDLQQSLVTVTVLRELGVEEIWAKAISVQHALILERLGATRVVQPEAAMGERLSHLLMAHMLDFVPFDEDHSIAKTPVPDFAAGRPLSASRIAERHGVRVVAVKRRDGEVVDAESGTVPLLGDVLVLWGRTRLLERFSDVV